MAGVKGRSGVYPRTEYHRKINSDGKKGKPSWSKGVKFTEEHIRNMSLARIGKPGGHLGHKHSEESKIKMGLKHKGNKYSLGRTLSEETKDKLRVINIGKKHSEESKKKRSDALKLDKHWNWKGGKSFHPYPPSWGRTLRKKIRARDNHTCQVCGIGKIGKEQHCVHHIDYNKQNCEEYNLITLCRSCHIKTNLNRLEWEKYFIKRRDVHLFCIRNIAV